MFIAFIHSRSINIVPILVGQINNENKSISIGLNNYSWFLNYLSLGKGGETEEKDNGFVTPKVVIVFADRVPAGKLLQAAKDEGVKDNFLWIGSDAWASRESVVENKEEFVEGAIAIHPLRRNLPAYNEYFQNLVKSKNERNPWFKEYVEIYHNCSTANVGKSDMKTNCDDGHQRYKYLAGREPSRVIL